jgi:hypothetical protein
MQRERRKHEQVVANKVNELRPKQVWSSLENDKIYDSDSVVKYVKDITGIDDNNEAANIVNNLIDRKALATSRGIKDNKLYLRRNPYVRL